MSKNDKTKNSTKRWNLILLKIKPAITGETLKNNHSFNWNAGILLLAIIALLAIVKGWQYSQQPQSVGLDFYQFWVVSKAVQESNVTNIYSDSDRKIIGNTFLKQAMRTKQGTRYRAVANARRILETYSTPFLYTLFYPLSLFNYEDAYSYYQLICMLCTICTIIVLCMITEAPFYFIFLFITLFFLFFEPLMSDIRVANVNQIELGFISAYLMNQLYMRCRFYHFVGGGILGLAIMFKPNLIFAIALLGVTWMMNREFLKTIQFGCGFCFACLGAILVSSFYFQSPYCWSDWIKAIQLLPDDIISVKMGNLSLAMFFKEIFGITISIYLTVLLFLLAILLLWHLRKKCDTNHSIGIGASERRQDAYRDSIIISIGCLVYLLSARLVWLHYYVLALPAIIISLRPIQKKKKETLLHTSLLFHYIPVFLMIMMIGLTPIIAIFINNYYQQVAAISFGGLLAFTLMFEAFHELQSKSSGSKGPIHK